MNRSGKYLIGIICLVVMALLFLPIQAVHGQESQTITGTGTMTRPDDESFAFPLSLTFPPAGGDVTGTLFEQRDYTNADGSICALVVHWTLTGTFEGGDGGAASGPVEGTLSGDGCTDGIPVFEYNGSWSGNFYANGSGSGIYDATVSAEGETTTGQFTWVVSYPEQDFAAALQPIITSEYIFSKYGIYAVNSFPGDIYGQKSWTEHELALLDDVLKNLPKDVLDRLQLKRIVRNQYDLDKSGQADPNIFGSYTPCVITEDPGCSGSAATLRVFDLASSPFDYPDADTQFKGTILHEITHSMTWYKDEYSIQTKATNSPLVQNYLNATRPDQSANAGAVKNGWVLYGARGWVYYGSQGNMPPTKYGEKSPTEDLCESVMMYVYDPVLLQASSTERYNFIRDQIFGGVEYENGIPKTY